MSKISYFSIGYLVFTNSNTVIWIFLEQPTSGAKNLLYLSHKIQLILFLEQILFKYSTHIHCDMCYDSPFVVLISLLHAI